MRRSESMLIAAVLLATGSGCAHRDPTPPQNAIAAAPIARVRSSPAARRVLPVPSTATPSSPSPVPVPDVQPTRGAAVQPLSTPIAFLPLPFQTQSVASPQPMPALVPVLHALPPAAPVARAPKTVPMLASDAPPEILGMQVSSTVVTGGQTVDGSVLASSNVASVEVRVAGYSRVMEKVAPGRFTIAVTVPNLPFFLRHRTYSLQVVARNTRGDATTQSIPITVR